MKQRYWGSSTPLNLVENLDPKLAAEVSSSLLRFSERLPRTVEASPMARSAQAIATEFAKYVDDRKGDPSSLRGKLTKFCILIARSNQFVGLAAEAGLLRIAMKTRIPSWTQSVNVAVRDAYTGKSTRSDKVKAWVVRGVSKDGSEFQQIYPSKEQATLSTELAFLESPETTLAQLACNGHLEKLRVQDVGFSYSFLDEPALSAEIVEVSDLGSYLSENARFRRE